MKEASEKTKGQEELENKSLSMPEEVRPFPHGRLELVHLAGVTAGKGTFEPGWKWSESVKPIAGTDSCQSLHTGYVLSGRMTVVMNDGTTRDLGPNEAFVIPPGHDAWVIGNEPCVMVDFTGFESYARRK